MAFYKLTIKEFKAKLEKEILKNLIIPLWKVMKSKWDSAQEVLIWISTAKAKKTKSTQDQKKKEKVKRSY